MPRKAADARFIDLFAGIGGMRLPFDELGYECVFSSEWDVAACDTYEARYGDRPHGDHHLGSHLRSESGGSAVVPTYRWDG